MSDPQYEILYTLTADNAAGPLVATLDRDYAQDLATRYVGKLQLKKSTIDLGPQRHQALACLDAVDRYALGIPQRTIGARPKGRAKPEPHQPVPFPSLHDAVDADVILHVLVSYGYDGRDKRENVWATDRYEDFKAVVENPANRSQLNYLTQDRMVLETKPALERALAKLDPMKRFLLFTGLPPFTGEGLAPVNEEMVGM